MMIERTVAEHFKTACENNKLVVLRGPSGTGKRTLATALFSEENTNNLYVDCAVKTQRQHFSSLSEFTKIISGKQVLVVVNTQLLENANELFDWCLEAEQIENVVLLCSFEPGLDADIWEALRTGGVEVLVSPLSYAECAKHFGLGAEDTNIDDRLLFGYYPEVVTSENKEAAVLNCLESSVIRQLSSDERINKKEALLKLLRQLSFQIGDVISYNDLGNTCGLDNETVERYIVLFEKAGLLFRLPCYHTNGKYELKKSFMVYFTDNGIRNALIRSFQPMEYRNDAEQLWKNWVLSERRKQLVSTGASVVSYFWLTHTKQQMDYLEISEKGRTAYQISWQKNKKIKVPKSFTDAYPDFKTSVVFRATFWGFLRG